MDATTQTIINTAESTLAAAAPALIAAAVGAAGVGTSVYEGVQSKDASQAATAAQQQAVLQSQQAQANYLRAEGNRAFLQTNPAIGACTTRYSEDLPEVLPGTGARVIATDTFPWSHM